ncbi:MAG: PadR family transcriptional regulator [Phycisphaerae bacterium]|nr:PadR family transcriptional regulator [Phycisphaerae bacterium]
MVAKNLWGTLETLILEVLSRGANYGYQIAQTIVAESGGYFDLKEGSLYPALHRLERQGLLTAFWEETREGRRRKFYRLTPAGQGELSERRREWSRFSAGVNGILRGADHVMG